MRSEPERSREKSFPALAALESVNRSLPVHFPLDQRLISFARWKIAFAFGRKLSRREAIGHWLRTHISGVVDVESFENVITSDHYAAT